MKNDKSKGIASFVLGILSLIFFWRVQFGIIASVIGIILATLQKPKTKYSKIGFILNILSLCLRVVVVIVLLLLLIVKNYYAL